jgi:hypothetical protein
MSSRGKRGICFAFLITLACHFVLNAPASKGGRYTSLDIVGVAGLSVVKKMVGPPGLEPGLQV